jgi:probable F420-dependent oxidoreductase
LNIEWLGDLVGLRRAAVAFDQAGYDFVTIGGHLLTAPAGRYPDRHPSVYALPYRDPFVLFSALGAVTERLAFRTAVLILPMLPTALVAKQAADLSLMTGGRLELGVGISWQEAEYRALGQAMAHRGPKLEEQITVLRLLWSQPSVTFQGRFHDLDDIGLGQRPEVPVPIWIGCAPQPALLDRVARLADGWIPSEPLRSPEAARTVRERAAAHGRNGAVAVAGRVVVQDPARAVAEAADQRQAGATEIIVSAPAGAPIDDAVAALARLRPLL